MDIARIERERVEQLEEMLSHQPQVDLGTQQIVNGKVVARTIFIPADTVLTGAVHKKDAINIVSGDITVTTDHGPRRFTGYHVLPSFAGSKRAGVAHSDTYWTTLWHSDLTDQTEIEDEMTDDSARLQSRLLALPAATLEKLEN